MNNRIKIGIDFGGVLSIHDKNKSSDGSHMNTELDMPQAIESLHILKERGYELYLISFCGKKRAEETKKSLEKYSHLFQNYFFVKSKDHKGQVCNFLGIHIMIDDTDSVLFKVHEKSPITKCILFENWKKTMDEITKIEYFEIISDIISINSYVYKIE